MYNIYIMIRNGQRYYKKILNGETIEEICYKEFGGAKHNKRYLYTCIKKYLENRVGPAMVSMQKEPMSNNEDDYSSTKGIKNPGYVMKLFNLKSDSPTVGDAIQNTSYLKKYEPIKAERAFQYDQQRGAEYESVLPSLLHERKDITVKYKRSPRTKNAHAIRVDKTSITE